MMKKSLAIFFTIISCLIINISACLADPMDWQDSSYNFKGMNNIAVFNIDFSKVNVNSNIRQKNWNDKYIKESSKHKLNSFVVIDPAGISISSDLYVVAELSQYNNYWVHTEAYTSWEQQQREHTWYDDRGHSHTDYWYETVPVYHPAADTEYYDITMHYYVYDSKTNKLVFEREDSRSRGTDDPTGMFGRSFDNFFSTLRKITRD